MSGNNERSSAIDEMLREDVQREELRRRKHELIKHHLETLPASYLTQHGRRRFQWLRDAFEYGVNKAVIGLLFAVIVNFIAVVIAFVDILLFGLYWDCVIVFICGIQGIVWSVILMDEIKSEGIIG